MAKEAWHPQADIPLNSEFVCSVDVKVHCYISSMKSSEGNRYGRATRTHALICVYVCT